MNYSLAPVLPAVPPSVPPGSGQGQAHNNPAARQSSKGEIFLEGSSSTKQQRVDKKSADDHVGQILAHGIEETEWIFQALRICLEWSSEAIYFLTHQFELIHFFFNRINSLLAKSLRKSFLEDIFLILLTLAVLPFKKHSF